MCYNIHSRTKSKENKGEKEMKQYRRELVISILQLLTFYIYPIIAIRIDPMAMVLVMLTVTMILGFVLGLRSRRLIKYLYPIATAVVFLPTVPIFYNDSALVHALWYLVMSAFGLGAGALLQLLSNMLGHRHKG